MTYLNDEDAKLMQKYAMTFVMGKERNGGECLVPVFFSKMTKSKIRKQAGVSSTNRYLFAYTEMSHDGCLGYNELHSICKKLDIPTISAIPVRH